MAAIGAPEDITAVIVTDITRKKSRILCWLRYGQNNRERRIMPDGNRNIYNGGNRGNINTNDKQRNNVSTMDRQRIMFQPVMLQRNRVNTNKNVSSADKQGNVYKKDNNQWQSREGNNWSKR